MSFLTKTQKPTHQSIYTITLSLHRFLASSLSAGSLAAAAWARIDSPSLERYLVCDKFQTVGPMEY
jgi:hypothetical protein